MLHHVLIAGLWGSGVALIKESSIGGDARMSNRREDWRINKFGESSE